MPWPSNAPSCRVASGGPMRTHPLIVTWPPHLQPTLRTFSPLHWWTRTAGLQGTVRCRARKPLVFAWIRMAAWFEMIWSCLESDRPPTKQNKNALIPGPWPCARLFATDCSHGAEKNRAHRTCPSDDLGLSWLFHPKRSSRVLQTSRGFSWFLGSPGGHLGNHLLQLLHRLKARMCSVQI